MPLRHDEDGRGREMNAAMIKVSYFPPSELSLIVKVQQKSEADSFRFVYWYLPHTAIGLLPHEFQA